MDKNQSKKLGNLRQKIDEIDQDIHRLLMRRADVVKAIGQIKAASKMPLLIQPAREADVIKKIIKRHRGSFPLPSLQQIWREIMSASLYVQKPFTVGYVDDGKGQAVQFVRHAFGVVVKPKRYKKAADIIADINKGKIAYGLMTPSHAKGVKIVVSLPLYPDKLVSGKAVIVVKGSAS